jgi:hypothetical protein
LQRVEDHHRQDDLPGRRFLTLASLPGMAERTVTVGSAARSSR